MADWLSLVAFPRDFVSVSAILVIAIFAGLQVRRRRRTTIFAIFATLISTILAIALRTIIAGNTDTQYTAAHIAEQILRTQFGTLIAIFVLCWIVIYSIQYIHRRIRARRIFTKK